MRDKTGKSRESFQRILREVYDNPQGNQPNLQWKPRWDALCAANATKFSFPLHCQAQLDEAFLTARRIFYNDKHASFHNEMFWDDNDFILNNQLFSQNIFQKI